MPQAWRAVASQAPASSRQRWTRMPCSPANLDQLLDHFVIEDQEAVGYQTLNLPSGARSGSLVDGF
jgi:hypothetical protein